MFKMYIQIPDTYTFLDHSKVLQNENSFLQSCVQNHGPESGGLGRSVWKALILRARAVKQTLWFLALGHLQLSDM